MGTKNRKRLAVDGKTNVIKKDEKHQTRSEIHTHKSKTGECTGSRWSLMYISAYSVVVLAVYIYTMYPSISGGDSGELIAAAHELGVAHPPGYPLFTVLSWLTIQVVPFGTVAWRMNLLNAVFSAAASFFFALTVYRYTRSVSYSVAGASLWCFSKLTWTWSASAEVFGLNNLFVALLLYLMVLFQDASESEKARTACLGSFVCGLSLCNQHTIVVYVVVIAAWVLKELAKLKQLTMSLLLQLGFCFLCGLVPYAYLPLSAYNSNGRWTWGDQRTVEGFLKHLLRVEYGTFDLAKKGNEHSGSSLYEGLSAYGSHTMAEFTVVGVVLALLGVYEAFHRHQIKKQWSLLVSAMMCAIYLLLFSWRANLDIENHLFRGVVERFWMQSDCVIVLLAAVGLSKMFRFVQRKCATTDLSALGVAVAVGVCAFQMQRNFSACNQRNNTVIEEFGLRLIHNVPPNAFIFTVGDLPSNVLRYLYLCENHRPDIQVFDQEILTYSWAVTMLRDAYPGITFPGHHMERTTGTLEGLPVFNSKAFLDANYDRAPIIGCIGVQSRERSWQEAYQTLPYGHCQWLLRHGAKHHIDSLAEGVGNMTAGWRYPFQGFESTSWERVATDEMWNAKVTLAAYLYDSAVKKENPDELATLMVKAYKLYKAAIEPLSTAEIPDYWHKNYALTCERMLNVNHEFSKADLLNNTIHHFQTFIDKTPTDKDVQAIKEALVELRKYVGKNLM